MTGLEAVLVGLLVGALGVIANLWGALRQSHSAHNAEAVQLQAALLDERERVERLMNRLEARSLAEFVGVEKALDALAVPLPNEWLRDDTGLIEEPVYDNG